MTVNKMKRAPLFAVAALAMAAGCGHGETNSRADVRQVEQELTNRPSLLGGEARRMARSRDRHQQRPGSVVLRPTDADHDAAARCLGLLRGKYSVVDSVPLPGRKIAVDRIVSADSFSETMSGPGSGVRVLKSEGRIEVSLYPFSQKLAALSRRARELRSKIGARVTGCPGGDTGCKPGESGTSAGATPGVVQRLVARLRGKQGAVLLQKVLQRQDEEILAKIIIKQLLQEGHAVVHANGERCRDRTLFKVRYKRSAPGCRVYRGSRFYTRQCEAVFETMERETLTHPCLVRW